MITIILLHTRVAPAKKRKVNKGIFGGIIEKYRANHSCDATLSAASFEEKTGKTSNSINLDAEASFIATDDPMAARAMVSRVLDAVDRLVEQPGMGRPGRVPGTRELVVPKTRYIVPYRVRGDTVEILRAFHASRRLPERC